MSNILFYFIYFILLIYVNFYFIFLGVLESGLYQVPYTRIQNGLPNMISFDQIRDGESA